ncbi:hypothetical protein VMCG_08259 [Cytospora schulzeri]|uniref:Uncharacterized protein n=1 Tax=Cytospora schulzeri TaxID=448051 RepID=A0A423VSX4_9PEZI|nr:hypothetical protein VMCG_08259 [Valsa malicola]
MASTNQTSSVTGVGDQAPAVQEPGTLRYNSDCVVYLFFGRDQSDPQSISNIWIRMTRPDLDSPDFCRRALTQYIQTAINLGLTHYYPYFGDILIFPISWSPQGRHRRRLILRTEPLNNGQIFSLLPENVDPDPFPMNLIEQQLVEGNPFEGPCRQIQTLELEGISTSEQSWDLKIETIARLRELAEMERLPPGLDSFPYSVGIDAVSDDNAGRGAWSPRRLGPLLTREYLNEASGEYARASSV